MPECLATSFSSPVDTSGGSVTSSGTAWRCMFEPISARLASSCSRNGISPAETPTICFGRDVDVLDLLGRDELKVAVEPAVDAVGGDLVAVGGDVGRGEHALDLLVGPQPHDLVGQLLVLRPSCTA